MQYRYTAETFYLVGSDMERAKFNAACQGIDTIAHVDMSGPEKGREGGRFTTPDGVTHRLEKGRGYVFMREPVASANLNNPAVLDRIIADINALDPFDGGCPADCGRGA